MGAVVERLKMWESRECGRATEARRKRPTVRKRKKVGEEQEEDSHERERGISPF